MAISDDEGLKYLRIMLSKDEYAQERQVEALFGTSGGTTLLMKAAAAGRTKCVDFLLSHGGSENRSLLSLSSARQNAAQYARKNETDIVDPHHPSAPPARPHRAIANKLLRAMGEYVEVDLAEGTPAESNWNHIKHQWDMKGDHILPFQWQPERPHYPVRDRGRIRKRPARISN